MAYLLFSAKIFYHKPKYEEITQSNPKCVNFKKIICLTFFLKDYCSKKQTEMENL